MKRGKALKRSTVRTVAGVPKGVLAELNAGTRASGTLVEALALDFAALLRAVCPRADGAAMDRACGEKMGVVQRMQLGGALVAAVGEREARRLAKSASDTVRGWACYALAGQAGEMGLAERFERVRAFAADEHSGVREWAWMAVRPYLAGDVRGAVKLLTPWVLDSDANVRRFATEATRPRGVWCAHLEVLKAEPQVGLPLLEPLRSDGSKYVQDSVGNWLNDAAKTCPKFVREVTTRWLEESPTEHTRRICRRGLRSL